MAAATTASWSASSSRPNPWECHQAAKPPPNASPAPMVSATSTFGDATGTSPAPVTTWTPSGPRVSSTTRGPAWSSIRAASAALRCGSSQARSSSETLTTSLRASTRRRRRR